jgi:hypothetical protein
MYCRPGACLSDPSYVPLAMVHNPNAYPYSPGKCLFGPGGCLIVQAKVPIAHIKAFACINSPGSCLCSPGTVPVSKARVHVNIVSSCPYTVAQIYVSITQ